MKICPYCASIKVERVGHIERGLKTNPVYGCLECDEIWEIKEEQEDADTDET